MKVIRKTRIDTNKYEVGDQIEINLKDYGKFTATAHKVSASGAIFIFDNCVADRPMDEVPNKERDFWESDLCKWMNEELIKAFPKTLVSNMASVKDHPKLRIPTYGEMFGHDRFYENFEADKDNQLTLMKDRKNRICLSPDNEYCWYWLQNRYRGLSSAADFAVVTGTGRATDYNASNSFGVRPVFVLINDL